MIVADENEMQKLEKKLSDTVDAYMENYNKLTGLISDIQSGVFTGEAATDFVKKYEDKKEIFEAVRKAVQDAKEYMNRKRVELNRVNDALMSDMK